MYQIIKKWILNLLSSYCSSILIYSLVLICSTSITFGTKEKKNHLNTRLTCKPEETMHRVASILLIISSLKLPAFSITLLLSCKAVS